MHWRYESGPHAQGLSLQRILITGASGFIGTALVRSLLGVGADVRAARRGSPVDTSDVQVGDLGPATDWRAALEGVATVIHLAGPAHRRCVERVLQHAIADGAAALAAQAEEAGVGRFIFMSSIKAAAARTEGAAISERDPPQPGDAYGRAKLAAEAAVLAHGRLNPIVLRPPLVHAPDAKANFAALLALAAAPLPAPLAGVQNRRSLISRDALIGAVRAVLAVPEGAGGVFHLAEQPALSSAEIVTALRRGLGRAPRLAPAIPFLPAALRESLEVDDSAFRAAYGYAGADRDARDALAATAAAWKASR
ncbi:MAG: NAD-dependent epimerase/dehydratase family protein [Hyphomonadaceae bacterium]